MSKVRVYEVARDLNVDQDHLVGVLQSLGFSDVRNRMSKVDADAVERVRRHIESQQRTPEVVQERLSDTVIRRRRVGHRAAVGPDRGRWHAGPAVRWLRHRRGLGAC